MQKITATLAATAALALSLTSARADDATKARLATGEIIVQTKAIKGSTTPRLKAMAVVGAPPERIWKIVDQCADYPTTMVRIAAAEEVSRKGNIVRCKVTVDMPFPLSDLTALTEAVHTVQPGKMYKREWKLVEGDYRSNRGSWTLVPFDDAGQQTLVVYEVHADPKVAIPDGIKKAAQKKSIPELLEKIRENVK
jgi:ribosome-associated toxin RatA of RatAB toxin-antitoxin module